MICHPCFRPLLVSVTVILSAMSCGPSSSKAPLGQTTLNSGTTAPTILDIGPTTQSVVTMTIYFLKSATATDIDAVARKVVDFLHTKTFADQANIDPRYDDGLLVLGWSDREAGHRNAAALRNLLSGSSSIERIDVAG